MSRNQNGLSHILSTIWHYILRLIQYGNPCAGKLTSRKCFQEQNCKSQSGLTNIPLFLIYVYQILCIFGTFTGYFCLNHYITEKMMLWRRLYNEQCCGIYLLYLKNFNIDYLKNIVLLVRPLLLRPPYSGHIRRCWHLEIALHVLYTVEHVDL